MFSRRGRKKENSSLSKKDLILIICLLIAITLLCFLSYFTIQKMLVKYTFNKDIANFVSKNQKEIFSLDKIFLFSSCDATSNDTQKALWDLDIFQYTDIAIYLNNNSSQGLTNENTIKNLWIDHIEYGMTPELGTPTLYFKDINEFGKSSKISDNQIQDSLNYTVVEGDSPIDYSKPMIDESVSSPITLEFINQDVKKNTIISNTNSLVFDGSLLSKANIPINSIRSSVSFRINIINNLDEMFSCNVSLEIPLQNSDEESIIEGNITKTFDNLNHYKFYKLEKRKD